MSDYRIFFFVVWVQHFGTKCSVCISVSGAPALSKTLGLVEQASNSVYFMARYIR